MIINRRKFLRGMAASPIAIAAASLPKEAAAKPKPKPEIQPLPGDYYVTMVSAMPETTVLSIPAWRLES